jgi:hypothetical protein
MHVLRGSRLSSTVSVVTVPVGGTVGVAMEFAVCVAGAVGMAVEVGEVLAEGLAVMCAGHVGLRS